MKTYRQQQKDDVERITEHSKSMGDLMHAQQSGAFRNLTAFYAAAADAEAAKRQRIERNPKAWLEAWTSQPGGPSAADMHVLLNELHHYLRLRPELADVDSYVEEAAACAKYEADSEEEAAEVAEWEAAQRKKRENELLIATGHFYGMPQ